MKVLLVCSGNNIQFEFSKSQAFIYDQIEAICRQNKEIEYSVYFVKGKGIKGYLSNLPKLRKIIKEYSPDIIHAHGGHVGVLTILQRLVPVVVTFHGSDINFFRNRLISIFASLFADASIYVSPHLLNKSFVSGKKNYVIPCGVDFDVFYPISKSEAKLSLGFPEDYKYVLFTSWFNYPEKNYPLAKKVMIEFPDLTLQELKNRSRSEVNLLLNGSELLLMTSYSEGSPQIIKEAMACNCPIVSTDVGDVKQVIQNTEGTFLCNNKANEITESVKEALNFAKKTNGRNNIKLYDNMLIAEKIVCIYDNILNKKFNNFE